MSSDPFKFVLSEGIRLGNEVYALGKLGEYIRVCTSLPMNEIVVRRERYVGDETGPSEWVVRTRLRPGQRVIEDVCKTWEDVEVFTQMTCIRYHLPYHKAVRVWPDQYDRATLVAELERLEERMERNNSFGYAVDGDTARRREIIAQLEGWAAFR